MKPKLTFALTALVLTLAIGVTAAFAGTTRSSADPGVTSTSILLGTTSPLSGVASAYASVARGADAYFKYVNARGGVNGRKISDTIVDDQYNPQQTVLATRKLVEQDGVFAMFNTLGTEQNLAIRDYLNANKVPQLFAASGATAFGSESAKYPYTIGLQPSYQAEGWVLGKYLARTQGSAKVAVLFQNDDYGKDLLNGLKKGMQRSKARVVAAEPFEATAPDVQSQMAKLRSSGASTLAIFATPKHAIQAYVFANRLNWKPKLTLTNAVASASNIMLLASEGGKNKVVEGSVSIVFLKDPTDPKWKNDAAMKLYRSIMKRFKDKGISASDPYNVYGMSVAHTFVQALKHAGKNPTRAGIMKAATHLTIRNDPFLLPGVVVRTTSNDHFPLDQARLERWHNGRWVSFGGLFRVR